MLSKLGWETEYTFHSMIDEMIEYWENKLTNKNEMIWADSL
jgi:nucleoside-diphosphate-sugar epimerase